MRVVDFEWHGSRAYLASLRDITETLRLEAQVRHTQKMEAIGKLAGGVAHDFNNLTSAILCYTEYIRKQTPAGTPQADALSEIHRCADRAASLAGQLLAFSRKAVIRPEPVNLNSLIQEVEKMLHRLIGADIELITAPDPSIGQVMADPTQLEQVIMNLVVNARDAMPRGGVLIMETQNLELTEAYADDQVEVEPGHYVVLTVSDNGQGMDEETAGHAFEPFYTTKEVGKGTGLGLATVYGIVKQSGGHIGLESDLGRGTTFKIYLPMIEDTSVQASAEQPAAPPPRGQETLLLVEDEPSLRKITRIILESCGYTVLEAQDGQTALRVAQQHPSPIDLLVTDVVMPKLNGHQLAQELAQTRPGMKVLYLSGYTDDAIIRYGVMHTDTPFLPKPFTPDSIAQKIREVLDARPDPPDR